MPGSVQALPNVDGPNVRDWLNDTIGVLQAKGGAYNLSLAYAVGSNALTIAAKQQGGSDADTEQYIVAGMRSATATSGDFSVRSIQAALSLVVSSGSTLGQANSDGRWTYVYLIDNAGTLELAVSSKFHGQQGIVSTTTEGGAGAADSATVMYSTTGRSNVPFLCVGRFKGPQTVAGTWASVPTAAQAFPFEEIEQETHSTTCTGFSVDPSVDVKIHKQADLVTLTFPEITGTSDATGKALAGALPAQYWPPATLQMPAIRASDNGGTARVGLVTISTAGVVTFFPTDTADNWTASGTATIHPFGISYSRQ